MDDEDVELKRILNRLARKMMSGSGSSNEEKRQKKGVVHLNEQNFNDFISRHKVVLVDCWAEWCAPCRFYGPIFERVASSFASESVGFGKLNVDENPGIAMRYGIRAIPTTLVFVNGELVDMIVGLVDEATLSARVKQYLARAGG